MNCAVTKGRYWMWNLGFVEIYPTLLCTISLLSCGRDQRLTGTISDSEVPRLSSSLGTMNDFNDIQPNTLCNEPDQALFEDTGTSKLAAIYKDTKII